MASTYQDARDTCIEGDSGLLSVLPDDLTNKKNNWNRSLGELELTNGTIYKLFTAEKPDRLRGPQFHRSWCDELASWSEAKYCWDMLQMTMRLGPHPQIVVTTTPRPLQIIRDLCKDPDTRVTTGSTYDNAKNLPKSFIDSILAKYEGTRLGEQELYAKLLDDVPGALWKRAWIENCRILGETPEQVALRCARVVVAIDPAITSGENADSTGIVAMGIDERGHGYVLADWTCRESPRDWAAKAIALLERFKGDLIVGETNNGGDMVESTIRMVNENTPFRKVTATRGKFVRAEPIAALSEQGRIHFVGNFPDLEDQMCTFTPDNIAANSPDNCDSMVWAATELFDSPMTFGALSVLSAEVNKSPEQRMAEDLEMRKVRTSSLQKPVVGKETLSCSECGSKSIHVAGSMRHCSVCGFAWVGDALVGLGGSKPRYDLLAKGR